MSSVPTPLSLLREMVRVDRARTLLIDGGPAEPVVVTRGAFLDRVDTRAAELAAHGVAAGDCVAVWLPNWSESLVWQFAAIALGAHVIGINTRYNVEDVAHVLSSARPKVVAVAHGFHKLDLADRLRRAAALAASPSPSIAVITGPDEPPAHMSALAAYDVGGGTWTPADIALAGEAVGDPEALAVAFTTSGSTGKPKLPAHTAGALARHALAVAAADGWNDDDVTLCALPLSGVFAFMPAITTIVVGGVCLLEPVFDAARIVSHMARFGVSRVIGADDIVGRLADAWRADPVELPHWTRLLFADFTGKSHILAAWAETQFGLRASAVYGSSELFALLALRPADDPLPRRWKGGGTPVSDGTEVRAIDPETGEALPAGIQGELAFRGPTVVDDYLGQPELRERSVTADGWFRSGDMGVVSSDRSFEYTCRIGDALRLRGFLVEPAEIEERIAAHPDVAVTKVVGLRAADGETEAVAFAVLRHGATADEASFRAWCAEALAAYKVPRSIHIIAEMPTTVGVNGSKIRTAELRLWAEQRAAEAAKRENERVEK